MLITKEFVQSIISNAKEARKTETIKAEFHQNGCEAETKEGFEKVEGACYLVVSNGTANANYIITEENFHKLYENVSDDIYRRKGTSLVYKMEKQFSVQPSWSETPLISEENGAFLMIYGEGDYNICSFSDFEKTYEFIS